MFKNRNVLIVSMLAMVSALGYGIIIPILYSYSKRFGLSDFDNGLLFSLFSIAQFFSTPILGRISDKFGRRPILVLSPLGTAFSFFLAAFAPNAFFLFAARGLDGLTAGNLPAAAAVISDSTDIKDRAKGFGIIGASFGFGFVFGPAIATATVGFGQNVPFIIAGILALIGSLLAFLFLPETNKHIGQVSKGRLIDIPRLWHALTDANIGPTLLITLIYSFAFGMLIYVFQPFSVKALRLSVTEISALFTLFGAVGLVTQLLILPRVVKKFGLNKTFRIALLLLSLAFFGMFLNKNIIAFVALSILFGFANSYINPLLQTILSEETDAKSQGSIMGINSSYMSLGTIVGPIAGGAIATVGIAYPFLAGAIFIFLCLLLTARILKSGIKKESAF